MGLINQSGMYQGTPALNPLPYVQMAMQARARKAAKDEAIDRYYQKLPDTINEKGIRDAEIPIINDAKNKLFEYGMQNREALRNPKVDNGAARYNLDKMMREVSGVARMSQNAGKTDLENGKFRLQKGNQWINDDDEFMQAMELHNLPVTDPNHKTINIGDFLQNKPFDEAALVREIKGMFPASDGTPIIRSHPTDKNLEIVESNPQFNDAAKQGIFALAADKLHGNKAFRKKIEDDVSKNPELLTPLNEISKKVFGHYIREDFADEDIAAAYLYSKLPTTTVKQKVIPDKEEAYNKKLAFNQITDKQHKENIRLNQQGQRPQGAATTGNSFDETEVKIQVPRGGLFGGKQEITITKGVAKDEKGNPYTGEVVLNEEQVPANAVASMKAMGSKSIGKTKAKIVDGVITEMTPQVGGTYNRTAIENGQRKVNTEPIKNPQMEFGNKGEKPKPAAQSSEYSKQELIDGGWTEDQYNKAKKAGKIPKKQ